MQVWQLATVSAWCDKCGGDAPTHRVEFSESVGAFRSERWVQDVCDDCANDFLIVTNDQIWDVEVRAI